MQPDTIFKIANTFVLAGWLLLLIIPKYRHTQKIVLYAIVGLLSLVYVLLIAPTILNFNPDAFSTLANVRALFENDAALTAGWVHYLAFDLFVGAYIVNEGIKSGMPRWQYSVCLPFAFMFGPVGLLLFYLFKTIKK